MSPQETTPFLNSKKASREAYPWFHYVPGVARKRVDGDGESAVSARKQEDFWNAKKSKNAVNASRRVAATEDEVR
jgi:hypothetical protein